MQYQQILLSILLFSHVSFSIVLINTFLFCERIPILDCATVFWFLIFRGLFCCDIKEKN